MANNYIQLMNIIHNSITDGPGMRSSIFCAGCSRHCPGCHNSEAWSFLAGNKVSVEEIFQRLVSVEEDNVTFLGGEPMEQPLAFAKLAKMLKEKTKKDIWIYSGFTYEEIINDKDKLECLKYCDVLVDGPFILSQRDISAKNKWRGSTNQRIISIQESLKNNQPVFHKDN